MPSTFFGLNIGYTGLISASASLNTTGNNIANVDTEGYSRQKTVQEAAKAIRTNTTYGMAGAGVDTISIDQIRNPYYDLKYWENNADLGIFEIKQQYAKQIESYFTDTDSVPGFNAIFSDLFDSIDEVRKSSGDSTVKQSFIAQCEKLTDYFNGMYNSLQKLQNDANDEIQNKVNHINAIAAEIATLNKQINVIEVTGTVANELRDKRNLLIDELSVIVDVDVQEIPVYTTTDPQGQGDIEHEESGIYRYIVNIAGGQNLVNGYEYSTLECVARNYKNNQSDCDGLYDIKWSSGIDFNLYGGNLGGELKGLIEVRDGNNDEYFHGKATTLTGDSTTGQYVTVKVNGNLEYLTDMNKNTLPAEGRLQISNKLFEYTEWSYNPTTNEYTLKLAPGEDATDYIGLDAMAGGSVDYQGIPYYMSQLNEWCRSFAQAMNKIELTAQDTYGDNATVLFKALNVVDNDNNYDFSDYDYSLDSFHQAVNTNDNNYLRLTAGTFTINEKMKNDVNLFGTTADITKGQDAQDITEELFMVKSDKSKMVFRGCTSEEFLQCVTTDTALNASNANTFYENFSKINSAIVNQRLSEMGVDNDEEGLNLVKFQEAFNLASKMIQVMTEIYDQLILRTGV